MLLSKLKYEVGGAIPSVPHPPPTALSLAKRNVSIVLPSPLQAAAAAVMRRGPLIFITSWQKGDEEKKVLSSQLHTTSARCQPLCSRYVVGM
jgi:hypothetical protein